MWRPVVVAVIISMMYSVCLSAEVPNRSKVSLKTVVSDNSKVPLRAGVPDHLKGPLTSVLEHKRIELRNLTNKLKAAERSQNGIAAGKPRFKPHARNLAAINKRIKDLNEGALPEMQVVLYVLTTTTKYKDIRNGFVYWVETGKNAELEVMQILEDNKILAVPLVLASGGSAWRKGSPLILDEWPTKGPRPGKKLKLKNYIEVCGKTRHEFDDGTKREVLVVKPFDPETIKPYLDPRSVVPGEEKVKPKPLSKPAPKAFSTWTDSTGKFTIEARFLGFTNAKVTLEKKDGTKVTLPIERLSKENQEWVRGLKK
jgi:SLA1 Homology Domain 1 (SHD1) protein